jgi:hypothetical protein
MSLDIGAFHTSIAPVGSRETCTPAPTDTDRDWLVLVPADQCAKFYIHLNNDGWTFGGSAIDDEANTVPSELRFQSFTKGEENLIVTTAKEFHRRFIAATSVSKRLNLLSKDDRIALFQAVLYGNAANEFDFTDLGELFA